MKKKTYLFACLLTLTIGALAYYNYDQKRAQEIENKILSFQKTYQDYINKKDILSEQELNDLFKNDLFKTSKLNEYYQKQQDNADTSINAIIQSLEYNYNFLKMENTTNYQAENKIEYDRLIKENDNYFDKIKTEDDFALFDKVNENNKLLLAIVQSEVLLDEEVNQAYLDGLNNVNTSNLLLEDCFTRQTNLVWKLDPTISENYCEFLDLDKCKIDDIDEANNEFIGFTMNNPKLINKNLSYEYVSLHNNEFQLNDTIDKLLTTKDYQVHVEVYTRTVNNHTLYKYNIVLISNDYVLACPLPKA